MSWVEAQTPGDSLSVTAPAPRELARPGKIGKYEIVGVAGRGTMGIVYCAHDPFTGRRVAIKVCALEERLTFTSNRLARKLFFNEAHTAGTLDHPNILRVHDAGEEDGQPYIVMEYVDGARTLRPHCAAANLLPLETVVEIGYKCARALDYAHRRGVVHRDIKPTNIMLTRDGDVKIGDFGIAQSAHVEATQVMGVLGSPRYLSPEQVQEDVLGNQTDLYSLGVVLYELCTGRPPFDARGFSQLIYKILHESALPLRVLRPEAPAELQAIVSRALAKDLAQRYPSGREMAADLAKLGGGLDTPQIELSDDRKYEVVRALRFFNDFSNAEIWEVMRAATWMSCAPGQYIITEGHMEHALYIIVSGDVLVLKNQKEIGTLGTGDCFGEMAYLSRKRRTASILARDDVMLLKINSTLMEQASIMCQLRFNKVFLHTLIERLTRTSESLVRGVG